MFPFFFKVTSHTKVSLSYPLAPSELRLTEQLNTLCRGRKHAASAENVFQSQKLRQCCSPADHSAPASLGAQDTGKDWPDRAVLKDL